MSNKGLIKWEGLKQARVEDVNSSKARFEVKYKSGFKRKFPNQGSFNNLKVNKGKGSKFKVQEGKGTGTCVDKFNCAMCGMNQEGKCQIFMSNCYNC